MKINKLHQTNRYYVQTINNVLLLTLLLLKKDYKKQRPRRVWVRDILRKRKLQGDFHNLLNEMKFFDQEKYFKYLRMNRNTFQILLNIVSPKIEKIFYVREPISAAERLALTLRYLASGDSMMSISFSFRIAHNTVSKIIKETCEAIWECLFQKVLLQPSEKAWLKISQKFEERWQLPHCIGAMDGKHVTVQALPNFGSTYYNYKGAHSIVLLALCDAEYKFTLVDIGAEGCHSDGGIFRNSEFGKLLFSNKLNIPGPRRLGNTEEPLNYYFAADEAFPLSTNIMRPYPGRFLPQTKRIFNYRLSRGRRIIENTFGLLASRWRIYRKPIHASQCTVMSIIKATVCLHNFLMILKETSYCIVSSVDQEDVNGNITEGSWRNEIIANLPIRQSSTNTYGRNAERIRSHLCNYFMNEGATSFQWNK